YRSALVRAPACISGFRREEYTRAHAVCVGDGDSRILFAILHDRELAVDLHCPTDASEHLLGMPELVIRVDQERQIDGTVWKLRIDLGTLNHVDIRQLFALGLLLDDAEQVRLNLVGVHLPVCALSSTERSASVSRNLILMRTARRG